ncbi:MAG: flavodoxin family protein [Syntrophobacteraceae bacterium]|nr:flavodoxin family protein [Desulfobacteraceae bacterium]
MKIIGLVGSPHGERGNTARLLRIVLEGAEREGAVTETLYLEGDSVQPCLGCDTCHKKGRCVQKDAFESIQEKIVEADGLVLGSPNYIFSVSAQMKAFMDRCCGAIHCLRFQGKYGATVVTSGGGDEPLIAEYMNHFLMITGIRPVGSVWATMGKITGDAFPDEVRSKALELGGRLVQFWKDKTVFPEIERRIFQFSERMRALMINRKDEWPYEYDYWKKHRNL